MLPARELHWRFSRSSGPGGQGVNTADSRVELSFDLGRSPSFPRHLRERAERRLAGRLVDGVLTVVAIGAPQPAAQPGRPPGSGSPRRCGRRVAPDPPARRPTRPTTGAKRRRLDAKARRGAVKRLRGGRPSSSVPAAGDGPAPNVTFAGQNVPTRAADPGVSRAATGGLATWTDSADTAGAGRTAAAWHDGAPIIDRFVQEDRGGQPDQPQRGGRPARAPVDPARAGAARPAGRAVDRRPGRDVSTQLSTSVRAEVELAKAEVTAEVRKGVTGSVFFAVAAAIGLFSLFFLFFALAELLSLWLLRWVAFAIVFVLMVLGAALFGFLGYRKVRKIRKPERTIESLRESAQVLQHRAAPTTTTRAGRSERVGALTGPSGRCCGRGGAGPDGRFLTRRRSGCPDRGCTATSPRTGSACTSRRRATRVHRWWCCCTASRSSGGPGAGSCPPWPRPGSGPSRWTCAATATRTSRPAATTCGRWRATSPG